MTKSPQNSASVWLSTHWIWVFNLFFLIYVSLPVLAPILLANGYSGLAGAIYRAYGFTCHQLPSHSYFIAGHQVAMCQRCIAVHATMALAGAMYGLNLLRLKVLDFRWFLLFMIPIAMDGGMAFVSELLVVVPISWFWGIGLTMIALMLIFLRTQKIAITWQVYLFFLAGPLALIYLQVFGPHESTWWLRTITGSIYAVGTIWLIYPMLEESSPGLKQETRT